MLMMRQTVELRKDITRPVQYTLAHSRRLVMNMQQKLMQAFGSLIVTAGLFTGVVSVMAAQI